MFRRLRYPMHPPAAALAVTEHADNPHARAVSCGAYSVAEKAAQHARLQQRFVPDRVAESAREDTLADLLPGDAPVRQQQFDSCLNGPLRKLKFSDIALVQRHFACLRFTEDAAQLRPFPADTAGKGRRRPALHRAILVEHTLPQKQRDGVDEPAAAESDGRRVIHRATVRRPPVGDNATNSARQRGHSLADARAFERGPCGGGAGDDSPLVDERDLSIRPEVDDEPCQRLTPREGGRFRDLVEQRGRVAADKSIDQGEDVDRRLRREERNFEFAYAPGSEASRRERERCASQRFRGYAQEEQLHDAVAGNGNFAAVPDIEPGVSGEIRHERADVIPHDVRKLVQRTGALRGADDSGDDVRSPRSLRIPRRRRGENATILNIRKIAGERGRPEVDRRRKHSGRCLFTGTKRRRKSAEGLGEHSESGTCAAAGAVFFIASVGHCLFSFPCIK